MKKICALILSVVMMLTMCMPAIAAEAEKVAYDGNPVVIVRGIDFRGLTYADTGESAMTIELWDIIDLIFDLIIGKFVVGNQTFLQDALLDAVWAVMGPIASNPDGSSADENVSMKQYFGSIDEFSDELTDEFFEAAGEGNLAMQLRDEIGAENIFYFTYDWRKNPEKIADELDKMIDIALEQTGKDKVHIAALSMGGMVTTGYMYYKGNEKLESVAYLSAAHNGTYVCGDALNGRIVFDADCMEDALLNLMPNNGLDIITRILLLVAKALGATEMLCDFLNNFVKESSDMAYNGGLRDILGTAVGMWALCPDEDFASGMDFIFSGSEEKYADVISQLKETEKFVCSTEEIIEKAYDDGVKVVFTSNYNQPLIPIYPRANLNSDSTLEAELTSNFAVFAPYGEKLTDEQIAGVAPEFISADKVINASTCLYPEYTWFTKDADHVAFRYGSDFAAFAVDLILSETQPTVDTLEGYQRFMRVDEAYNLYPLK